MKKEVIFRGMAWGHLPGFMIEEELQSGQLLSIIGRHFPGVTEQFVAGRRRYRPHGPLAINLWSYIEEHDKRAELWRENRASTMKFTRPVHNRC